VEGLVAQYELIAAKARPEWGESQEQVALRRASIARGEDQRILGDLSRSAASSRVSTGLVDFHAGWTSRDPVVLEVRRGSYHHWHELERDSPGQPSEV